MLSRILKNLNLPPLKFASPNIYSSNVQLSHTHTSLLAVDADPVMMVFGCEKLYATLVVLVDMLGVLASFDTAPSLL